MPELPNVTVYVEALARRAVGQELMGARIVSPFVLRTVTPGIDELSGRCVAEVRRSANALCSHSRVISIW